MSPRTALRIGTVLLTGIVLLGTAVPAVHAGEPGHGPSTPAAAVPTPGTPAPSDGPNATVTGTVTDEGEPVGNAWVFAVDTSAHAHRLFEGDESLLPHSQRPPVERYRDVVEQPRPPGAYVTRTDGEGEYTLSLPPGTYTVHAITPPVTIPELDVVGPGLEGAPMLRLSAGERVSRDVELGDVAVADCFCPFVDTSRATGLPDGTVSVDVSTGVGTDFGPDESRNATGYDLTLTFDERVVQVVDVEGAELGEPDTVDVDNEAGRVRVVESGADPVAGPTLTRVEFRIVANETTETYLLLSPNSSVLSEGEPVTVQSDLEGKITVAPSVAALVAGEDGRVQFAELQRAARLYASGEPVPGAGGETVDLADLQELAAAWAADGRGDVSTEGPA